MKLDLEQLREQYAGLSDDALFAVDRDGLVDEARECYDAEVESRGFDEEADEEGVDSPDDEVCVCAISVSSMSQNNARAEEARAVLDDANIPCQLTMFSEEERWLEYRLMVPARFSLVATSLLDKAIFNAEIEEQWTTHLSVMSDRDFRAITLDALLGGLEDRMERLRRVYEAELQRRNQGR
jgi:hypothetical protein